MQKIDLTIRRACRNTIGDAVRRSAARNPEKDALMQEHASAKLASFKRPRYIFFVDDLPRNAAGKILKRELREEFGAGG